MELRTRHLASTGSRLACPSWQHRDALHLRWHAYDSDSPMTAEKLFEVLGPGGAPQTATTPRWDLPSVGSPGRWMRRPNKIRLAFSWKSGSNGFHLIEADWLATYVTSDRTYWLAEGAGEGRAEWSGMQTYSQARLLSEVFISDRDTRPLGCVDPDNDTPRRSPWPSGRQPPVGSVPTARSEASLMSARESWSASTIDHGSGTALLH